LFVARLPLVLAADVLQQALANSASFLRSSIQWAAATYWSDASQAKTQYSYTGAAWRLARQIIFTGPSEPSLAESLTAPRVEPLTRILRTLMTSY
jgi:hypothetical protein